MKKHFYIFLVSVFFFFIGLTESKACHAIALVNFTQQQAIAGGIQVRAASDSPTCGCAVYWLDCEVRCTGQAFNGAPFSPGFWGPLSTYPFFQSAQMNKPNCVVQNYPWITIPFSNLCPGMTYQYRMRENHNGSVGPWCAVQTFTVPGVTPPFTAAVNTSGNNICAGTCVTLTAAPTGGGCGIAVSYTWSTGATTSSINVCPATTTTYTVGVFDDCDNVTVPLSITINVLPNPVAGTAAAAPTTVCSGQTVNLSLVGSSGNVQWQSAPAAGGPFTNIAGATATSFTSAALTTNTCFRAQVTGCGAPVNSNVVCVTVNPSPVAPTASGATICSNGTATLTATAPGGTYQWYNAAVGGTLLNTGASYTTPNLTATTTYYVQTTVGGCVGPRTPVTVTVTNPATINTTPVAATCVALGSATATPVGGTPGFTYSWAPSGGTSATASNLSVGIYTVTVTDAVGCVSTGTANITQTGSVTSTFTNGANACLTGNTYTFTNTGSSGGGITHAYTFNPTAGAPASGATANYGPVSFTTAGTYTVTHTVTQGTCVSNSTSIITIFPMPNPAGLTPVNPTCGNSNGQVTVSAASGGTPGYQYNLNGGVSTALTNYPGLAPGTYTVNVIDANGCTSNSTTTLVDQPGPTAIATTPTGTTCGASNGQIVITGQTGGTGPYTYSLDGSAYTGTMTYPGLGSGNHTVGVTDANGCVFTTTVNIPNAGGPTGFTGTPTQTSCTSNTGTISVSAVVGGLAPYSYSFNNGVTFSGTANATGLAAGTYTVIVSDANNCAFSQQVVVTQLPPPNDITFANVNATCGLPNGQIVATGVGGTPGYQYSLNGGVLQASGTFTGLAANTYTITVTDINGCTYQENTTITNPGNPVAAIGSQTNVSCNGGTNGAVNITVAGGTPSYTYTISPAATGNGSGGFTGMGANSYTVTVTDVNGCSTTQPVTITQPTTLTASLSSQTNVSCNGGSNGTLTVAGANGSPTYNYSLNGGPSQASGTFSALSAANYTVTVTDANGCTATQPVTITQPAVLTVNTSSVNANCTASNGTATANVSGGTSPYNYVWSPLGGTASTTVGLPSGNYTATVTDNKGCIQTATVTIGNTPGGTANMSNVVNVTCNGSNNGSLTVSMGGGATAPFNYVWSPNVGTTSTVSGLSPGSYSVTVTDAFGCVATANGTITQPAALTVNLTSNNVSCFGGNDGTITATPAGGTLPYNFLWTPTSFTTASISTLPIGTYSLTVTDAKGCTVNATRTIVQPTALSITPTITQPHCGLPDGAISLVGSGGAGGYTFSLNGGAFGPGPFTNLVANTYTVTIRDANLCSQSFPVTLVDQSGPVAGISAQTNVTCNGGNNGSATVGVSGGVPPYVYLWSPSSQTSPTAVNLNQGVYGVTVTDASGCVATAGVTITQPTALVLNVSFTNPICNGSATGTGTASTIGGVGPYNYSWSTVPTQTSSTATGLTAGSYNVIVTDANGCTKNSSINLTNPPAMTANINATNLNCFNFCTGSAIASVNNGTAPYQYTWNDPNTQTASSATGLCAGSYTVNVVDANGCNASASTTITQPPLLTSSISNQVNINCFGNCIGSGQVNALGGTPPYVYSWTNGTSNSVNNNLCAGSYTVIVTDSKNCTTNSSMTITQPPVLTLSATKTDASCFALCNGTGTAVFGGGTAPYNFVWQPSLASTAGASNLCAGTHTVTITDANGCNQTSSITVNEPPQLSASTTSSGPNFCGQNTGSAQVSVMGGSPPFQYLWSNGAVTAFNSGLGGGSYIVNVTDANGCSVNAVANVNDVLAPTVTITSSTNISCFGANDGTAVANIVGGTPAYSSTWVLPNGTPNPIQNGTGLHPGNNTINVTDAAGCSASATVNITQPPQLVSLINGVINQTCNPANGGICDGQATMLINGGTAPYAFAWNDPGSQTNSNAIGLCASSFTCTVTDGNGCTTTQNVTITVPPPIVINNSLTNITCFGFNNGIISSSVTGGTPGYLYSWTPGGQSSSAVTSLAPGTYSVTVTDSKGCSQLSSGVTVTEPAALAVDSIVNPSKCSGLNGDGQVNVSGGTPAYVYLWNDPNMQTTATASGLGAGTYNCTILDNNGCTISETVVINDLPPPIIDNISFLDVDCNGSSTGSATVTALIGGSGTLNYTWTNTTGSTVGTAQTASALPAGIYNVSVVDGNGCLVSGSVTISEPSPLVLSTSTDMIACNGQTLGIFANAGGGTSHVFDWGGVGDTINDGGFYNVIYSNTTSDTLDLLYTVTLIDGTCPQLTSSFTISVLPAINITTIDSAGCINSNVALNASAVGGDGAPYTFTWNTGSTNTGTTSSIVEQVTSMTPVTYTVVASDGCSLNDTATVVLSAYPNPTASILALNNQGCSPLTVSFSASAGGPQFPNANYEWYFGDATIGADSVISHVYTAIGLTVDTLDVSVIVTSNDGCKDTASLINYVIIYPQPIPEFSTSPLVAQESDPVFNFINLSQGSVSFVWNFGEPSSLLNSSNLISPIHSYENSGTYDVTLVATSQFGCVDSITHPVVVEPEFGLYVPNAFTPNEDLINEVFLPKGFGIDEERYTLYIFDRWGEKIFESNNFNIGWDGKAKGKGNLVQEDVYVWKIIVYDKKNNKHNLAGHVTVVK